jgi:hypothetical protein
MAISARTIAASPALSVSLTTKLRSILIRASGNRVR